MLQAAEDQRQENHCCWWSLKVITMEYSKTYNTTFCFKENVSSLMKHSESKCLLKNFFWYYLYYIFFMYMLSLQNIHTISEEKTKQNKTTLQWMQCIICKIYFTLQIYPEMAKKVNFDRSCLPSVKLQQVLLDQYMF